MNRRSTVRLGVTATGALLVAIGSALIVPAAAAASPARTAPAAGPAAAGPRPAMWIDCSALSWAERIWYSC